MDRRSFIKLSSLAGASVAVSTGLAGCTVNTSTNNQPQTNYLGQPLYYDAQGNLIGAGV